MKKKFDSVGFMRERRAGIEREDKGLTWAEKSAKTMKMIKRDPLAEKFCRASGAFPSLDEVQGSLRVAEPAREYRVKKRR